MGWHKSNIEMCATGSDYLQHPPAVFTVYNCCIITELCLVQEKQQNQGVQGIGFFVLCLCLVLCQTKFHHQPLSSDRLMFKAIFSEYHHELLETCTNLNLKKIILIL